jgi:hypothetical protein
MRLIRAAGLVVLLAVIVFAGVGGPGKNALAGSPGLIFDICLQDESNGNILQFNSTTGGYQFTACPGVVASGTGSIRKRGCVVVLEHIKPNLRLSAQTDTCMKIGKASLEFISTNRVFTVADRNTANNTCSCGAPPPAT